MSDSTATESAAVNAELKQTYASLEDYVKQVGAKRVLRKVLIANNVRQLILAAI